MRETIETVMGEVFWSDDHWATVWQQERFEDERDERHCVDHFVTGKKADRVRYLAVMKFGGGRDDDTRR